MAFMSRGRFAERVRLSLFILSRAFSRAVFWVYAHPLLRWRFLPMRADQLLIAPQDLRTADATRASEIYAGRFAFAGKVVTCDRRSPFDVAPPSAEWADELAGFGWLRHLRAAESNLTRSNARSLVDEWITAQAAWNSEIWQPQVAARRVVSWLTHAPFLLAGADVRFYRRFLRSLSQQVGYLRRASVGVGDGLPRLQLLIALNYAGLCMAGRTGLLRSSTRRLGYELQRQILPDGGHISRNPGALIELLLELLPLRQAFGARNLPAPPALVNAIDRMMPMLRFFRHGDGAFAQFNGMGPTPPDLIATVLAYDDARGKPVANAAHSGYQRLETAGVVLVVDSGPVAPLPVSQEMHAGCLSFELSARRHRIVVNCGLPATSRDGWRHLARNTEAHSTLGVAGVSSCAFVNSPTLRRLLGAVVVSGPRGVPLSREQDFDELALSAAHDGYATKFRIVHERTLSLAAHGRRLDGADALRPTRGDRFGKRVPEAFVIRFHLHPAVQATRLSHRSAAMLMLPNRDVWTFEAYDHPLEIEDSVYLAGPDGPRRTDQLVVRGDWRKNPRVNWSFVLADPAEAISLHALDREPELPL